MVHASMQEFDVEDCFLNTPQNEVLLAVEFWLNMATRRNRQVYFAVSKDNHKSDHLGWTSSMHHWLLDGREVVAVIRWELEKGRDFLRSDGRGGKILMQQVRGVPIGEQLSAAIVELVALRREYIMEWPQCLMAVPTARYRDNFFVAWPKCVVEQLRLSNGGGGILANELSALLGMPVKVEGCGVQRRVLEVHVNVEGGLRAVLGFR